MRSWLQTSHTFLRYSLHRRTFGLVQRHLAQTAPTVKLHDNSRILSIVEKKVLQRQRLLLELEQKPSSENIRRSKEIKELEPLHKAWDNFKRTEESLKETLALLDDKDPSMRILADEEYVALTQELAYQLDIVLPSLLIPKSPTCELSALLELKSGVGGSEASLFLSDVLRMYLRFAQLHNWTARVIARNELENGGMKDAVVEVAGVGAYDAFRWESGVHRVQRVPATEASGRIHTSTVAVVVLPMEQETDSIPNEAKLYEEQDIKIEVMRSRGAGGQHVNKTESAVRLTHIPTGITVSMQDERSQHQNKARAFQVLRARLLDRKLAAEVLEKRTVRRDLVRSADRSEKIRTYNFAQGRVTDHRLGLTLMQLESVMQGDGLQLLIDAIQKAQGEQLLEDIMQDNLQ